MLPAFLIIISIIILLITFLKSKKARKIPVMEELEKYYDMVDDKKNSQLIQKQLLECAVKILKNFDELNTEKEQLWSLYEEKLIGDEIWNEIVNKIKDFKYLKMLVGIEANKIRPDYEDKIFKDATLILKKDISIKEKKKKERKNKEDTLFQKKREVLERILREKLIKEQEEVKV